MPGTGLTPKSALTFRDDGDEASLHEATQELATDLDWSGRNHATASARDAVYSGAAVPVTGDHCRVAGTPYVYVGGAWREFELNNAWTTVALGSGYAAVGLPPQIRRVGSQIEMRGRFRAGTWIPSSVDQWSSLTTAPNTVVQQTDTSGSPVVRATALDGAQFPVSAQVWLNPRADGMIRIVASVASTVQYVDLNGVTWAAA